MVPSRSKPFPLKALPGEIRNQIFELCISDAIERCSIKSKWTPWSAHPSMHRQRVFPGPPLFFSPPITGIKVSVLPGWSGQGRIKTLGIGSLPLLFVSKQIHSEVSSLVDSRISEVSIGPYGIQYCDEDPNVRWELAYALLRNRPHILKHTKNVKVFLPWLRHDLLKEFWKDLGYKWEHKNPQCYGLMVVPSLAKCLKTFESLTTLDITLVAEVFTPPDLKPLLQLYDICSTSSGSVDIVEPHLQGHTLQNATPPLASWVSAWENCLLEHREIEAFVGPERYS